MQWVPVYNKCVLVYCIFKHLSADFSLKKKKKKHTNWHAVVTVLKESGPLAFFWDRGHSWCASTGVYTPMIMHSGVVVLHISPLARRSVTVAAGRTWVIRGSAVLISLLPRRFRRGEGYLTLALNRRWVYCVWACHASCKCTFEYVLTTVQGHFRVNVSLLYCT